MDKPFILGVIPARGGSKEVPRKNIRLLGDKPLLVYTIQAAQKSEKLSMVVVSTEDAEIASIASENGCKVIERPLELAQDNTPTLPVAQHTVQVVEQELGCHVDYVAILQATTPFRTSEDIDCAIEKLITTGADSVVSVCQVTELHPWKFKRIANDRLVPYLEQEVEGTARQDLPPAFVRNGGIYAVRRHVLMLQNSILGQDCRPYVMPAERSVDINHEIDLILAEALLKKSLAQNA